MILAVILYRALIHKVKSERGIAKLESMHQKLLGRPENSGMNRWESLVFGFIDRTVNIMEGGMEGILKWTSQGETIR